MIKIAPSILSADFAALGDAVKLMEEAGADYIHMDVMDGHFVPNITFGPEMVRAIHKRTSIPLDVHLMINNPDRYLDEFIDAGADIVSVHAEATFHLQRTLSLIKKKGAKASVALNPATPLSVLDYLWDDIDMVLIMTVNPGFGGQKYIQAMYKKIQNLKALIDKHRMSIDIEVDGGISPETVDQVVNAGANIIVAGSYVFTSPNKKSAIELLRGTRS